jgi:hypothetical protein
MKQIDGIKIVQVDRLTRPYAPNGGATPGGNFAEQAFAHRARSPIIAGLRKELGTTGASLGALSQAGRRPSRRRRSPSASELSAHKKQPGPARPNPAASAAANRREQDSDLRRSTRGYACDYSGSPCCIMQDRYVCSCMLCQVPLVYLPAPVLHSRRADSRAALIG